MIGEEGPGLAEHRNLMRIKSIGPVGAAVVLSVIGDIRDFADAGKLAAYRSRAPRPELQRDGALRAHHRAGNRLARTCLVQGTLVAKRFSLFLQNFYQRIQRRLGSKTNIAMARKFLGVIYHTLKNDWVFEDFPNFVLAS